MTSSLTKQSRHQLNLGTFKGRKVIANFDGGKIPLDAGIILIAELDEKLKITDRFAECFQDYRNSSYIDYSVHQLLVQRVYGIVLEHRSSRSYCQKKESVH